MLVQGVASNKGCARLLRLRVLPAERGQAEGRADREQGRQGRRAVAENVVNGTYEPLSRPIFIYVTEKAAQKPEVKEFVEFYLARACRSSRK